MLPTPHHLQLLVLSWSAAEVKDDTMLNGDQKGERYATSILYM